MATEHAHALVDALHEAMSMVRCPYYQHEGTCDTGCHSEPRCITDTPREGWERRIHDLRAKLNHE